MILDDGFASEGLDRVDVCETRQLPPFHSNDGTDESFPCLFQWLRDENRETTSLLPPSQR